MVTPIKCPKITQVLWHQARTGRKITRKSQAPLSTGPTDLLLTLRHKIRTLTI